MARSRANWWSKALQNKMILVVLLMMIVVPFIATPLDAQRTGLAALICEGFGVILLVSLMWRKKPDLSKESLVTFLKTGANTPALLFLGFVAVSLANSAHFNYSVQEALRVSTGVLVYFVVANQFRRSEHISKAVDLLVIVSVGASLVAFAQYSISNPEGHYATGLFGDHQLLGSFLMLLLPFVSVSAITEKATNKQLFSQIAVVLNIVALLISQARSAWIGAAVAVILLAALTLYRAVKRHSLTNRKHEVVMPIMLIAVAIGFFLLIGPDTHLGDRMQSTFDSKSSAMVYRSQLNAGAINMIKSAPLTGQGVGLYSMYQEKFTHSGLPIYAMHDKNWKYMHAGMGEMAHDLYLQTAAELGVPGAIVFVCIPLCFLVAGFRKVMRMDDGVRRSVLLATLASTVAFTIDAAASPSWQYGQISLFFWLTLGLGVGSLRPRSKQYTPGSEKEQLQASTRFTPVLAIMRGVGVAAAIALVAVLLPSITYAAPPSYLVPKSADIEPKNSVIFSFQSQPFTLAVTFTDNGVYDVTLEPTTVFSLLSAHQGNLTGTNNHIYQASIGPEQVTIQGAYTQNGITVSDTTKLSVRRP